MIFLEKAIVKTTILEKLKKILSVAFVKLM